MILFKKGIFKDFDHKITTWDEPTEREFNGKLVKGRPTKGFGDDYSNSFEYAGKTYTPKAWSTPMYQIKVAVEKLVWEELGINKKFTFCLCGYYAKDGKGLPHHSDTVPTLNDIVASISLGGPRVFIQRTYQNPVKKYTNTSEINVHKENFLIDEQFYLLENGDVLIFDGHNQMNSTHAVGDLEHAEERVNLTFRTGI